MSSTDGVSTLVVDDNEIVRRAAVAMLGHLGVQCDTTGDADEGVSRAITGQYDLMIVDIRLAGASGLEVTRRVLAARLARPPRIVGLTGDADEEVVAACREAGMADVLLKPVRMVDLERELHLAKTR